MNWDVFACVQVVGGSARGEYLELHQLGIMKGQPIKNKVCSVILSFLYGLIPLDL